MHPTLKERAQDATTHTLLTNIFIILSRFFSSLYFYCNNYSLLHSTQQSATVFQNIHTQHYTHMKKETVFHIRKFSALLSEEIFIKYSIRLFI
jgi:hypothetical protein